MFGINRWSPIDELFHAQRQADRMFERLWSELPSRAAAGSATFQVRTLDDGWQIDVPMAGIDPRHVTLDIAGHTLSIRASNPDDSSSLRFEQTIAVPQFVDVEKIKATHRHGLLQLTLPLKESVKPRRIEIDAAPESAKQLTAAA
jgi:HSP20 family protein